MVNWKAMKAASQGILIVAIVALIGIGGLINLSDKLFGLLTWSQAIAIGLAYVLYTFSALIRG